MSDNKDTVERYMEAFNSLDHEMILSCLTDDVIWEMPGVYHHVGIEAFDKEIENPGFTGLPAITVTRLIEEDNVVVAEGSVNTQRSDGSPLDLVFCDVFVMRDAKIRKLTSYIMMLNQS